MTRNMVLLGGGGWMMGESNSPLDEYAIKLSKKDKPKICFIPTATGDSQEVIDRFLNSGLEGDLSYYPLFKANKDWETFLYEQDVIYVGGGNTKNMLAIWKEWGIDKILRDCYNSGTIICGMSAGAICWFERCITDSDPKGYTVIDGLSFLDGVAAAHYSTKSEQAKLLKTDDLKVSLPFYGIPEYVALHFIDETLHEIISSGNVETPTILGTFATDLS